MPGALVRPGPMKLDAHFGKDVEAMAVQIEVAGEWMTARLVGEIDHHGARELREAIDSAVLAGQVRELELDFRDVSFMDSSGIGLVMGRYKLMQELGGHLRLINVAGHLKKVMILAGLDRLAVLDRPAPAKKQPEQTGEGGVQ